MRYCLSLEPTHVLAVCIQTIVCGKPVFVEMFLHAFAAKNVHRSASDKFITVGCLLSKSKRNWEERIAVQVVVGHVNKKCSHLVCPVRLKMFRDKSANLDM